MRVVVVLLLCCTLPGLVPPASAQTAAAAGGADAMRYVHPPPESALDHRYDFEWKILETALRRTETRYGAFTIASSEFMTERRQRYELEHATGELTIMFLGSSPELEKMLLPVRIPVDLDLQGYCVMLIRDGEQSRFNAVRSLADLKSLDFGLGLGWIDVDILRSNGLSVVTGSSYDGLFEMLRQHRFDVFLRSAVEVLGEYDQRHAAMPELRIEDSLILYYPMPMYFWFSKDAQGRRLAARVEAGMRMMLDDGSYQRIFAQYQDSKIRRLHLKTRRILRLDNPLLDSLTPFGDKRLWFDPQSYREQP
ncbi:MAG TPA: hypothetical protein VMI92_14360 [Steroidobacteraceae bacterium]|nr:hypothetical protein [Steroidobacteraceae bacterium]